MVSMKWFILHALALLTFGSSAFSQGGPAEPGNVQQPEPLPSDPLTPEDVGELPMPDELPLLPDEVPLAPAPEQPQESARYRLQLALDAVEPVLPPVDLEEAERSIAGLVRVFVKRFDFEGNRAFSDQQLAAVVARFTGREITGEELEEARVALTRLYIEAGYITSGAILPDQDVAGGVIKFRIVEGRLTRIELEKNFWFRSWWLRNQMRRAAGQPVNFKRLKVGLQLLRQNPSIAQVNAELKPDVKQGESVLHLRVQERQPFRLGFAISNRRPPSVGEGLGEISFANLNLTGHNDPLELRWGLARWTRDGDVEYAEFDNAAGSYEVPITPWDTTLRLHAEKSDSSIIDETFAALGITSRSTDVGFTISQPLYRTLRHSVLVSLGADRKASETFLLGRPFSLSPGAIDGETDVFALRFAQEWIYRSEAHVLAVRSLLSFGLHAFGSTRADPRDLISSAGMSDNEVPDSEFVAWLVQAQYVRRIFDAAPHRRSSDSRLANTLRETLLVVRANGQIADEPLLSLEQFSLGGMQSVRGYRENQLLRDNGLLASAELRVPVWLAKDKTPIVFVAPFFDFGAGWNANARSESKETIYSAGVGLIVNPSRHAQATLYWGHAFVDFKQNKDSLQDYGIHFAVSFNAF